MRLWYHYLPYDSLTLSSRIWIVASSFSTHLTRPYLIATKVWLQRKQICALLKPAFLLKSTGVTNRREHRRSIDVSCPSTCSFDRSNQYPWKRCSCLLHEWLDGYLLSPLQAEGMKDKEYLRSRFQRTYFDKKSPLHQRCPVSSSFYGTSYSICFSLSVAALKERPCRTVESIPCSISAASFCSFSITHLFRTSRDRLWYILFKSLYF